MTDTTPLQTQQAWERDFVRKQEQLCHNFERFDNLITKVTQHDYPTFLADTKGVTLQLPAARDRNTWLGDAMTSMSTVPKSLSMEVLALVTALAERCWDFTVPVTVDEQEYRRLLSELCLLSARSAK